MVMKTHSRLDIALVLVRITLGVVVGGHGVQKLLGWFGGFGYAGTMQFFTEVIGLPALLAFLIIVAETLGMVALISGFMTRLISASLIIIMAGAIITTHAQNGFFMNWLGSQAGEGFEFHLLVIALALVTLINGAGAYALDRLLFKFSDMDLRTAGSPAARVSN
jgi:putative oxidoreductase